MDRDSDGLCLCGQSLLEFSDQVEINHAYQKAQFCLFLNFSWSPFCSPVAATIWKKQMNKYGISESFKPGEPIVSLIWVFSMSFSINSYVQVISNNVQNLLKV